MKPLRVKLQEEAAHRKVPQNVIEKDYALSYILAGIAKQPELKDQEQWIRNEISYGTFERSISLPYSVDVEKTSATRENGVLRIVLPKHENAKPKHISIR